MMIPMNQLKYIHDSYIRHGCIGTLDIRVTLSLKGIKVNMGISHSNKPNGFDLTQAIIDSCNISIKECDKMITYEMHSDKTKDRFRTSKTYLSVSIFILIFEL
jgi:hypothetical protein